MATKAAPTFDKTTDVETVVERGYAGWKAEKVERALAQARDRSAMIPAEKVWSDLGLEG